MESAVLNDETCGTVALGEGITVRRMGFGAMRLTGAGIWGPPGDPGSAASVLRRAVELGVNLIDTADAYGPHVNEELIATTLRPYPDDLVIATKAGLVRPGPDSWKTDGHPDHLKAACDGSLARLGLDRIDLLQLHRPDPDVAFEDSVGALVELRDAGKVRLIGLSNVTVDQLRTAQAITPIASVQNAYNLRRRESEDVLRACEFDGIGFMPYFPLGGFGFTSGTKALTEIGAAHGVSASSVALAWLLARSPAMLPIPGTSSTPHLGENVAAASLRLTEQERERLDAFSPELSEKLKQLGTPLSSEARQRIREAAGPFKKAWNGLRSLF